MTMMRAITSRLLVTLVVLWAVFSLTFLLIHLAPGDPFARAEGLSPEVQASLRARHGLDRPLGEQYFDELARSVVGDFGSSLSFRPGVPVSEILARRLPISMAVGIPALGLALLLGIFFGLLASVRGGWVDQVLSLLFLVIMSASVIGVGGALRRWFVEDLQWLQLGGTGTWRSWVLPVVTLGVAYASIFQRLVRSNVRRVLDGPRFKGVRSRGVNRGTIFWKYVLPEALVPLLSYIGPAIAALLTGSFVVETLFEIPGMSYCFVQGAHGRDYPLLMGAILFYTAILVVLNLLFESLHLWLDPRKRYTVPGKSPAGRER